MKEKHRVLWHFLFWLGASLAWGFLTWYLDPHPVGERHIGPIGRFAFFLFMTLVVTAIYAGIRLSSWSVLLYGLLKSIGCAFLAFMPFVAIVGIALMVVTQWKMLIRLEDKRKEDGGWNKVILGLIMFVASILFPLYMLLSEYDSYNDYLERVEQYEQSK